MRSYTLQPHFLSGGLLWHMMVVVSFLRRCKTALSDYAPGLRDPSSSKLYQIIKYNERKKTNIKKIITLIILQSKKKLDSCFFFNICAKHWLFVHKKNVSLLRVLASVYHVLVLRLNNNGTHVTNIWFPFQTSIYMFSSSMLPRWGTFASISSTLLWIAGRILFECPTTPSLRLSWLPPRHQNGCTWWTLWSWENVPQIEIRWIKRFQLGNVPTALDFTNAQCFIKVWIVVVKRPRFVQS